MIRAVADRLRRWAGPLLLFAMAAAIRAYAAVQISLPPTQVSAYYLDVARNLAGGHGLVADVLWSYATPPLVLPQPAFALWMPLGSWLAALPMALTGQGSLALGQAAFVLVGALVAPLVWLVARDAAVLNGLPGRRAATVAVGSGLVAAVFGPFLLPVMGPDSSVPFTVLGLGACLLMPRIIEAADHEDGRQAYRAGIGLGVLLALAYLARQEALGLGLAYLVLLGPAARFLVPGARRRWLARALVAPILAGAVLVVPWLARNVLTFGSLGGQAVENLFFVRNEDVFAYAVRPTLARFLDQGPLGILGHIALGLWSQLSVDLLLTAAPIGALGLLAWLVLGRSPAVSRPSALRALLVSGLVTFAADGLLFPVATTWGTFRHASGPLLAGLIVLAALGLDAFVARVAEWRAWERGNAWLATLVLLLVTVPIGAVEVGVTATTTGAIEARLAAAGTSLSGGPGEVDGGGGPIVSDWSIWLAWDLRRPALALPDEPAADVLDLARRFDAPFVLVLSPGQGRSGSSTDAPSVPALEGQPCLMSQPLPGGAGPGARLYRVRNDGGCAP